MNFFSDVISSVDLKYEQESNKNFAIWIVATHSSIFGRLRRYFRLKSEISLKFSTF